MLTGNKFTGVLFSYPNRKEMDQAFKRLETLKEELEKQHIAIRKAFSPKDIPYPWTIGFLIILKGDDELAALNKLDEYLVKKGIDMRSYEGCAGVDRVVEFMLQMYQLGRKYEPGIVKIKAGECPLHGTSPMACQFCPVGHMTECHYPLTCIQAKCSHLERYDEDAMYRDEP